MRRKRVRHKRVRAAEREALPIAGVHEFGTTRSAWGPPIAWSPWLTVPDPRVRTHPMCRCIVVPWREPKRHPCDGLVLEPIRSTADLTQAIWQAAALMMEMHGRVPTLRQRVEALQLADHIDRGSAFGRPGDRARRLRRAALRLA